MGSLQIDAMLIAKGLEKTTRKLCADISDDSLWYPKARYNVLSDKPRHIRVSNVFQWFYLYLFAEVICAGEHILTISR